MTSDATSLYFTYEELKPAFANLADFSFFSLYFTYEELKPDEPRSNSSDAATVCILPMRN